MLDAFKIKPFELEPVYASWTDGPRFVGNPKKDPPVDDWLKQIKAGCVQRNVPEEYWHKVAQHFMGEQAKARLEELKKVMAKVQGGKYRWTWKKFKIAMRNMGWNIDTSATETIKVQAKSSSPWWIIRKNDKEDGDVDHTQHAVPSRSNSSFWITQKNGDKGGVDVDRALPPIPSRSNSSFWITRKTDDKESVDSDRALPPLPSRSSSSIWKARKDPKDERDGSTQRTAPSRSNSTGKSVTRKCSKDDKENAFTATLKSISDSKALTARGTPKPPPPSRSNSGDTLTEVTHAPTWLLNACNALDFLTSEHPKVMSTLSAILITAGSIPAIPAISAGAGGAVLASGAAHAVGAIAVGLGSWLKAQQDGHVQTSATPSVSKVG